jgi:hypothetical protein
LLYDWIQWWNSGFETQPGSSYNFMPSLESHPRLNLDSCQSRFLLTYNRDNTESDTNRKKRKMLVSKSSRYTLLHSKSRLVSARRTKIPERTEAILQKGCGWCDTVLDSMRGCADFLLLIVFLPRRRFVDQFTICSSRASCLAKSHNVPLTPLLAPNLLMTVKKESWILTLGHIVKSSWNEIRQIIPWFLK